MKGYLLSIDEGNSSIKIGLFDRHGHRIGMKSCSNIHLISEEPGFEMYDPELLWREVGKKIGDLIRISGINRSRFAGQEYRPMATVLLFWVRMADRLTMGYIPMIIGPTLLQRA